MVMGDIYGLIDSDTLELRYVGQTIQTLDKRLSQHNRGQGNRANPHLNNWIKANRVNIITLERDPASLDAAEIRWIREMREQGARLLNFTRGGNGGGMAGKTHTAEARAKISAANIGHEVSETVRARLSDFHKGRQHTLETRARMSATRKGHSVSQETRAKIGAANRRRFEDPAARAHMSAVTRAWRAEARI